MSYNKDNHPNAKCQSCLQHSKGLEAVGKCFYCYREDKDFTSGWYVEDGKFIKDKSYMDWNTYVRYQQFLETLDDDRDEYDIDDQYADDHLLNHQSNSHIQPQRQIQLNRYNKIETYVDDQVEFDDVDD